MAMKQRLEIAKKAKMCLSCHDPEYTFKMHDKNHNCGKGKKSRYSCRNSRCKRHMWICEQHQGENNEALEKFKDEYQRNHKLLLGLFTTLLQIPASPVSKNKVPSDTENLIKPCMKSNPSILEASGRENKNENPRAAPAYKNITTKEATKKLRRKISSSGEHVEVKPIPKGRAQFMIGQTKGKTRPLNILYDSGCYGLLLKEGVQHELGKSILKTKGPFVVNGVGNTSVKVNDEWLTTLKLLNGSRQAVEGWTVDEVTAPLPMINVSKAVKDDSKLQSMIAQLVVGGDCDILLGLMYNAIFPKEVHSLPNGLTIYELQITPFDDRVNSIIGGPHESFELMAKQVGGANFLFSNLLQTLHTYNSVGPPPVTKKMMTPLDDRFVKEHKEWELGELTEELFYKVDVKKTLENSDEIERQENESDPDDNPLEVPSDEYVSVDCSECGVNTMVLLSNLDIEEESTQALKKLQSAQQEGLQIEYRCPRCRECNDCRRSFQTERVSLRGEAEDQEIYDSVNIDWSNKQIVCHLPVAKFERS